MQKAATALKARTVKGAVKVDTVALKHLAASLAESHGVPRSQMDQHPYGNGGERGQTSEEGSADPHPGLGIPQVRKRAARMGRNPATGEAIKIKASKKIAFRASKEAVI